ncbi:MAG: hypothetical protein KTR15_02660 [Phycisphaeraceae bacterium]|nr:hypothetical protein [Phycisphaeraceae bacterium]
MPIHRTAALLAALMFVLCWSDASHAKPSDPSEPQPVDQAEETTGQSGGAALDHIERLEQMLRDAGVQPPARPGALTDAPQPEDTDKPILPASFATVVFETEAAAINARGDKAANAIKHVRRWLERDDVKRRVAAQDIIKTLAAWAEQELAAVKAEGDVVDAYILADNAIRTLGQDPLAKPFKQYMKGLQRDRGAFAATKAMAGYRRAMIDAHAVGLTGEWDLIDFQNIDVRLAIKDIKAKLELIVSHWPRSEAGQSARHTLKAWSEREAQAMADLPAWRYTWQLGLIQVGTETETKVITKPDGSVYIEEDTDIVYDPNQVHLYGTFQNTSDKPYRYTFLAAVAPSGFLKTPFNKLTKNQLRGYELVQTPLLQPGELHNWRVTVSVGSIRNLHRGGVTMVEVHERRAGR